MDREKSRLHDKYREAIPAPLNINDLGFETYLEAGSEKIERDQAVEKLMKDFLDAQVSPFAQKRLTEENHFQVLIADDIDNPEIEIYTYFDHFGDDEELGLHPERPHRHSGFIYNVNGVYIDAELLYEEDGKSIVGTSFRFAQGEPETWNKKTLERSTDIDLARNELKRNGVLPL